MDSAKGPPAKSCHEVQVPDSSDEVTYRRHLTNMEAERKFNQNMYQSMQEVVPHLYVGGVKSAWNEDMLEVNCIQHVFTIMDAELYHHESTHIQYGEQPENSGYRPKTSKTDHVQYSYLKLSDEEDEPLDNDTFDRWTQHIHDRVESKQNILVHCQAGISRSVTFVAAYLIRYLAMTRDDALQWVLQARCIACPNDGFFKKLKLYQQHVESQTAPGRGSKSSQTGKLR